MKYLSSEELAKIIELDYSGIAYRWYTFKGIKNSPTIRTNKDEKVKSCTCALHSIKDILMKRKCRYVNAYLKYKNER